jgi:LacI family transcriptional regulator
VLSDNFEGARQAVEYLIEQGHTSIAFIGGPLAQNSRPINRIYTIERRASGYRTALLDAGLAVNYDLYESAGLTPDGGYEACKRLLAKKTKFSAIFCANDETAIGAMKAVREAGLSIPQDMSVVGFDDIDMAAHYNPALTTVRINKEAMGAMAVKTLIARAADPEAIGATIMLDVDLIKRESVGPSKNHPK